MLGANLFVASTVTSIAWTKYCSHHAEGNNFAPTHVESSSYDEGSVLQEVPIIPTSASNSTSTICPISSVIIIGAGASGIGAAHRLAEENMMPIILEARNRIGGRVLPFKLTRNLSSDESDDYINIQLGANWIHGLNDSMNPMFTAAKKLGMILYQTSSDDDPGDDVLIFDGGNCNGDASSDHVNLMTSVDLSDVTPVRQDSDLSDSDQSSEEDDCENITFVTAPSDEASEDQDYCSVNDGDESSDLDLDVDVGKAFDFHGEYPPLSPDDYSDVLSRYDWVKENVEDFIDKSQPISLEEALESALKASDNEFGPLSSLQRRCFNWFFDRIAIDLAAPLVMNSVESYVDGESDGAYGEAVVGGEGYSAIVNHFANEFPLDIRLHSVVSKVTIGDPGDPVLVECVDGTSFAAQNCIVTLPIGVLRSQQVVFEPSLEFLGVLDTQIAPGLMNIVWLWFPTQFWPSGYNFFGVARGCDRIPDFSTFLVPVVEDQNGVRQAVLMCQVYGKFAEELETMSDETIAARAVCVLRRMFGSNNVPDAVGCVHSSWMSDSFARGSWSYLAHTSTGQVDKDRATAKLAEARERGLFFAGEAFHLDHRGTVHGAYLTGVAAAVAVLSSMQ